MQKPSISRDVHYNHFGARVAAKITRVHPDGLTVGLIAMPFDAQPFTVLNAYHADEPISEVEIPNTMTTPHGSWSWPPRV